MKIKIRPRLDTKLVAEARALGLDISRIVEEAPQVRQLSP